MDGHEDQPASTRRDTSTSRATRSPDSPPPTARSASSRATPASKSAPSRCSARRCAARDPGAVRRVDDGQGARQLRSRLPADQDRGSRARSSPSKSRSARAPTSAASSTSSRKRAHSLQARARRPVSTRKPTSRAEAQEQFDRYYQELIEAISATDDTLLERYLEGGEIARDEAIHGMKEAMKRRELFPLFCVSAEHISASARCSPRSCSSCRPRTRWRSSTRSRAPKATRRSRSTRRTTARSPRSSSRRTREPHVGDVSFFRIFSGTVDNGAGGVQRDAQTAPRSSSTCRSRRARSASRSRGCTPATSAASRSCATRTRTTRSRRASIRCGCRRSTSRSRSSVRRARARRAPTRRSCSRACTACTTRTRRFETHYNAETHETIIAGLGERHLEVAMAQAQAEIRRRRRALEAAGSPIARRSRRRREGQGRHKKQTGGRGQFGDCWVRIAPLPRGAGYKFVDEIVGGSIPRKFIPGGGQGHPGSRGARRPRRLSDGRLRGRAVRRLVPLGGLERNVVQDGRHSRVQDGRAEVQAGSARADSTRSKSSRPTTTSATSSATSPRVARGTSAASRRRRHGDLVQPRSCSRSDFRLYASACRSMTRARSLRREFKGWGCARWSSGARDHETHTEHEATAGAH